MVLYLIRNVAFDKCISSR